MDIQKRRDYLNVDLWNCQGPWEVSCEGHPKSKETEPFVVLTVEDKYGDSVRLWMYASQATDVVNAILKGLKEAQPGVSVSVNIDTDG